jgi:hypothetical protein
MIIPNARVASPVSPRQPQLGVGAVRAETVEAPGDTEGGTP